LRSLSAPAVIVLSWLAACGALAEDRLPKPLSLRSTGSEGGRQDWRMQQAGKVEQTGATLSTRGYEPKGWLKAIVPGTILNSLVAAGVYPEPYFGLNNFNEKKLIPDVSEAGLDFYTYWLRTTFAVPSDFVGRRIVLELDGINYRAEIWLNGRRLGAMAGMFQRGFFDVTDLVTGGGPNALAVLVRPPDVPGGWRPKWKDKRRAGAWGENNNGGDGAIGANTTMLMSVGWDFTFPDGIRDRNTGIWRDVLLYASGPVVLRNPIVKSKLAPDHSSARETIVLEAINLTDQPQKGIVSVEVPEAGVRIEKTVEIAPRATREIVFAPEDHPSLVLSKPKLWWPLNKGTPHLYDLQADYRVASGALSDRLKIRFGVREITSDLRTPDASRLFYVNGKRFFVRGSNWLPEAMLRTSDARTEAELRYTAQSGINFLRLWGGGIAESDRFYELCDELGIIVWTEFWQTGDTEMPADHDLHRANVADTVKRIRHHASNGYYVSANERDGVVPIEDLLKSLDDTTGYQIHSEVAGIHDGSPYVYVNPMFYYDDSASARGSRINGFCPEYGCPCLPTVDSLREMMDAKDLWPINTEVWDYLDGGGFHKMTGDYRKAVEQYGAAHSIEEFARKAQMVGAVGYRGIWENWNANRYEFGDRWTSGVLFWYHNSPIRQVAGRMWDWSLEPTAALYFTQDALEPLHAQFHFIKNTVSVNNELMTPFRGSVTARVFDADMRERLRREAPVAVPADGVANDVLRLELPGDLSPVHFVRLDLTGADGKAVSDTFYWRSNERYQGPKSMSGPLYGGFAALERLPPVTLAPVVTRTSRNGKPVWNVRLANPGPGLALMVHVTLLEDATGKPLRPSFYSDNFISLLPGEERVVTIETLSATPPAAHVEVEGWNVPRRAAR
jgi:mannosylglycoprotein endo-beta-mannosidase